MLKYINWKWKWSVENIFFYPLDYQPNGNKGENCLIAIKPSYDARVMWYDKTCNEKERHKFFCECEGPGKYF